MWNFPKYAQRHVFCKMWWTILIFCWKKLVSEVGFENWFYLPFKSRKQVRRVVRASGLNLLSHKVCKFEPQSLHNFFFKFYTVLITLKWLKVVNAEQYRAIEYSPKMVEEGRQIAPEQGEGPWKVTQLHLMTANRRPSRPADWDGNPCLTLFHVKSLKPILPWILYSKS